MRKITKENKIYELEDTNSFLCYYEEAYSIYIINIRSHKTGDAHLLIKELYKDYPNILFKVEVMKTKDRKRALAFWKSEGFKKIKEYNAGFVSLIQMEKYNEKI